MPKVVQYLKNIDSEISVKDSTPTISDVQINDSVIINAKNYQAKWVKFTFVDFNYEVHIEACSLGIGIFFDGCTFTKQVKIINASAVGYDTNFLSNSISIGFHNCTFNNTCVIGGRTTIDRDLSIKNCQFDNELIIGGLKVENQSLSIYKNIIHGKCEITNVMTLQSITLSENVTHSICRIESCKSSFLSIINNSVKKQLQLTGNISNDGIVFNDGVFEDEITLNCSTTPKTISIIGGQFKAKVSIEYQSRNKNEYYGPQIHYIKDAAFDSGLYVIGTTDLGAEFPRIERVEIICSSKLIGEIVFSHLEIGIIDLTGFNSNARLSFESILINQLKTKRFFNSSGLILSNVKGTYKEWVDSNNVKRQNALYISETNFGKAQLFQVNLDSFDRVLIHNTILSEISTSIVKWFAPEKLRLIDELAYEKALKDAKERNNERLIESQSRILNSHYKSVKEIYRQLKYAMERQGDKPEALYFQRWEMHYYKKIIDLNIIPNKNDKWILWASTTNDFGQNWIKPTKLLLLWALFFYVPIAFLASPNINHSEWANSWDDVKGNFVEIAYKQLPLYPQLLNPTHSLSLILKNNSEVPGLIHFFDFFHRLFTSFFIFQIVFAFRKYVKS